MTREELILSLEPQVSTLAHKLHARLPKFVCFDDLKSYAWIGAIHAVDRFDNRPGVRLGTFAEQRIKGAMLDYHRTLDMLNRKERKHVKATGEEIVRHTVPLEHPDGSLREIEAPAVAHDAAIDAARLMKVLLPRERRAVKMLYFEDLSQVDISIRTGVHQSRVSQLLVAARKRMAAAA